MPFVGSMHGGMELAGETGRENRNGGSTDQRVYLRVARSRRLTADN
jgi:hypothetical protein